MADKIDEPTIEITVDITTTQSLVMPDWIPSTFKTDKIAAGRLNTSPIK